MRTEIELFKLVAFVIVLLSIAFIGLYLSEDPRACKCTEVQVDDP